MKPESRPFSFHSRCKEGVEDPVNHVRCHTRAVIRDGNGHDLVRLSDFDPDVVCPRPGGIVHEVDQQLIELIAMRMCGHAHHDDMLYLGKEPQPAWDYPGLSKGGYASTEAYERWAARDPIATYGARLAAEAVDRFQCRSGREIDGHGRDHLLGRPG